MNVSRKTIIGKPVTDNQHKPVASIQDIVIDPATGKLIAVLVSQDSFILADEIIELNEGGIMIRDTDVFIERLESEDVQKIMKDDIKVLGNNVKTVKGDSLGKVKDFEVDSNFLKLSRLHVSGGILKDFLRGELIMSSKHIVEIKKDEILVKDIYLKQDQKEEAEGLVEAGV